MPFDTAIAAAKAHTAVAVKRARSRSSSKLKSLKHKVQASLDSAEKTHVHFQDGSVFHGVLKDGQPHGHGKYTGVDGTSYKGSFRYGHRHGLGKLQLAEGVYKGEFEHDLFHGKGRFRWTDGRHAPSQKTSTNDAIESLLRTPRGQNYTSGVYGRRTECT